MIRLTAWPASPVCNVENQVAGFRGGEREGDGFRVAHLTDHQDVRILAQSGPQRGGEGRGVTSDFNLLHKEIPCGISISIGSSIVIT